MERITECLVRLWDMDVGVLAWDEKRGYARFQYTDDFCNSGLEISPIQMPLSRKIYEFPALREQESSNTFCGLPGIFADSLPEKYGNKLMREWLERKNINFNDLNPVERLCYVGKRGMGALEYEPCIEYLNKREEEIILDDLVEVARNIIAAAENKEKGIVEDDDLFEELVKISTSAGGAKAKALVALKFEDDRPVAIYSGQASPRKDLSYWLLKISDIKNDEQKSDLNTGRLEYAYYLMAKSAGLEMMFSNLLNDKNGTGHFITQRFDRLGDRKIHMATLCGLGHFDRNPPGMYGYENLFDTARLLKLKNDTMEQLYRRMVFNILSRNQDDHSKNHSFLMLENGRWMNAPSYDICYSYNSHSKYIAKHQMSCNGKRDDFTYSDLLTAAKKADITNPQKIIKEVMEAVKSWPDFAKAAGFPETEAEKIYKVLRTDIMIPRGRKKSKGDKSDASGVGM